VRSTYVLLNNTYTPYMSVIREAIDAILKGEEFVLPKPILHDFIAKRICDPAFDREGWLDTHPDMSAYVVNKDAWARLVNQINSSDDSGLISFVERVDARIE